MYIVTFLIILQVFFTVISIYYGKKSGANFPPQSV